MSEPKELTLEEFVKQSREHLNAFATDWRLNRLKNPEHYPDTLLPGDWDEQLMIFTKEGE